MTILPSSDRWLAPSTLNKLVDDLAGQGFSILPGGLDESICATLLAEAGQFDEQNLFQRAGIGRTGAEFTDIRGDRIVWLEPRLTAGADEYLKWIELLRVQLNRRLFLGLAEYEGHLACYPPGAGYRKHLDRIRGTEARILTLIVYLNRGWNQEDGGQLRLYFRNDEYLDVTPEAGTIVTFLSADYWHEVLPSRRDRWSVTGWFRQAGM